MSEVITMVPVNTGKPVQPIPSPVPAAGTAKKCKREECKRTFQSGTAFVPPMEIVFSVERKVTLEYLATSEGRKYMRHNPLTREEILKHEFCFSCKRLATFKMYPTSHTIYLMEGWRTQNKEWSAKKAEEIRQRQTAAFFVAAGVPRRVIERVSDDPVALAQAIKVEDKHEINMILATAKSHESCKHHKRKPAAERRKDAQLRHHKVQADESSNNKRGGKGKKDKNSQKRGGKGKGRK